MVLLKPVEERVKAVTARAVDREALVLGQSYRPPRGSVNGLSPSTPGMETGGRHPTYPPALTRSMLDQGRNS